jgi:hypothetical protein
MAQHHERACSFFRNVHPDSVGVHEAVAYLIHESSREERSNAMFVMHFMLPNAALEGRGAFCRVPLQAIVSWLWHLGQVVAL